MPGLDDSRERQRDCRRLLQSRVSTGPYRESGVPAIRTTRTLDSHACRLRHKLGVHGDRFVVNVWGITDVRGTTQRPATRACRGRR
jgi:hypothetical protein